MTAEKNSHCSWCGTRFMADAGWPRTCESCQKTSYVNPLPVAVAVVPLKGGGLLGVRRGIEPRKGSVALPGGFIDVGESWQEACAREVYEELQVELDPAHITLHCVLSAPDGTVLIMGRTPELDASTFSPFISSPEAEARVIIEDHPELALAFPLHTEAARLYFTGGTASRV